MMYSVSKSLQRNHSCCTRTPPLLYTPPIYSAALCNRAQLQTRGRPSRVVQLEDVVGTLVLPRVVFDMFFDYV
jgi:hypothetical protein